MLHDYPSLAVRKPEHSATLRHIAAGHIVHRHSSSVMIEWKQRTMKLQAVQNTEMCCGCEEEAAQKGGEASPVFEGAWRTRPG